jgi:hypothetical protein
VPVKELRPSRIPQIDIPYDEELVRKLSKRGRHMRAV